MGIGVLTDARTQLVEMIGNWQFDNYFLAGYSATKKVTVVQDWPSDLIQNMQSTKNSMTLNPIVSVIQLTPTRPTKPGDGDTLGDVSPVPASTAGETRYAQVVVVTFQVDCWAGLQTGGGDQAAAIADGVLDCVFVNRNALASYRRLEAEGGRPLYDEGAQLWRVPITVSGRITQSYDA